MPSRNCAAASSRAAALPRLSPNPQECARSPLNPMLREVNFDIVARPKIGGISSEGLALSTVTVACTCLANNLGHARASPRNRSESDCRSGTLLLALETFALAWVANNTDEATHSLASAALKQAGAADRQARVMQGQLDAMEADQRPWIKAN
jgi:hypothetical protein